MRSVADIIKAWSAEKYSGVMLPGLGSMTCGEAASVLSDLASSTSAGVTEEQTPRVKQLVWVEHWSGSGEDIPCWRGENPLGFYADVCFAGKYKLAKHSEAPSSELADRKAAEQTRYEKAILAALEASRSPVSQKVDRYGIALMAIREGCAEPERIAREALERFGK